MRFLVTEKSSFLKTPMGGGFYIEVNFFYLWKINWFKPNKGSK